MTEKVPKSLVPILGVPFISHQLRLLRANGIARVLLCVGYLGQAIEDFVGDGTAFGMRVAYSYDGEVLLGTAGAIRRALPLLETSFYVLYGDSYLPCDYARVAQSFISSGKRGLMTIYHNEGHYDSSNVEASDGLIRRYNKNERNPSMQYIDYGLGVFQRSVFEDLPEGQFRDLADVYRELLEAGELASCEVGERFYEIGSHQGIRDLEERIVESNMIWSE